MYKQGYESDIVFLVNFMKLDIVVAYSFPFEQFCSFDS